MSAIGTMSVYDGQATPVAHNLLAESVSRDGTTVTATYKESLTGVPDYAQITMVVKRQKLGSGINRVSTRVSIPVMESVSGVNAAGYTAAPKVAYTDTVEIIGFFHERSLISGRRSARQLALNAAGSIGTSVTPITIGPVPELFDQLIAPT